jgi:signal transduction histidine kinase
LLGQRVVSISGPIRHRLVTVILLGVVTSALSLIALVRVISLSTGQRVERGRVGVQHEIARLITEAGHPAPLAEPPRSGLIGMRGGYVNVAAPAGDAAAAAALAALAPVGVPEDWRTAVGAAIGAATRHGARTAAETALPSGTLVVAAQPAPPAGTAWVGYLVPPPMWLRTWQIIVVALAFATALLATTAVSAVITVQRGAAGLNAALDALATDLDTSIPRPRLRELSIVADGIARLARTLARSREIQADLGRELAQKDRLAALGRVAAGVAHEVRNPLASIKLRLDLAAASDTPLPPAVEQAISHASREITRLDRLVADLLVVASPGIGPRQSAAMGALVRARVDAVAPWCDARNVRVRSSGEAAAPVDADAMARAIDNLVRNAVEASPAGSTVEVSVREMADRVSISIEDHGPGVPADRAAELFEPFFTTKPDGTGLGLAICRAIARAHGGDVTYSRDAATTRMQLTISRSAAVDRERLAPAGRASA